MTTPTKDLLEGLFNDLCVALSEKLKAREATAADLNVIRQLLKDNNINAPATGNTPINNLLKDMPLPFTEEDYEKTFQ